MILIISLFRVEGNSAFRMKDYTKSRKSRLLIRSSGIPINNTQDFNYYHKIICKTFPKQLLQPIQLKEKARVLKINPRSQVKLKCETFSFISNFTGFYS
ncbi:hypothetical protein CEXT_386191 [Caerostris extrusa]|uniref:Ribosomal protein S10 n=1 Tax=Caerostris extrusa TaxID=172846 RepID=A0AAV4QPA3_CAEEX|nr:hypothetical protein CEXT_386191 [Caerostris extrusa]